MPNRSLLTPLVKLNGNHFGASSFTTRQIKSWCNETFCSATNNKYNQKNSTIITNKKNYSSTPVVAAETQQVGIFNYLLLGFKIFEDKGN